MTTEPLTVMGVPGEPLVLRPGDVLVVRLPAEWTDVEAFEAQRRIAEIIDPCQCLVVGHDIEVFKHKESDG